MVITKQRFFQLILIFGLIVNIFIIFDVHYLYLRTIFSFIFLITIPGLLIIPLLPFGKKEFWEYLVYVVGISIAFLLFGGLLINTILPLTGTKEPLSLLPLLVAFDFILLIIWFVSVKSSDDFNIKITLPVLDPLNKMFFIFPIIFIILSTMGAISLNNNGSNLPTMIMFAGIAVYVFLLVILDNRLNKHLLPYAVLGISLALLLATSLRSWYVFGSDITTEFFVFQLTRDNFYWTMENLPNNAYNACLSIAILPVILDNFLKVNEQYIFKFFLQVMLIFTPVIVFFTFKRYVKDILAFLGVCFIIFSPHFFLSIPMHIRTGIALLFFSLILLVLFDEEIPSWIKDTLFVLFGCAMVLSHYSTSYITIVLFVITWFLSKLVRIHISNGRFFFLSRKYHFGKHRRMQKSQNKYLHGIPIFLIILFTFFWSGIITDTSGNIVYFVNQSLKNINRIFEDDIRAEGVSLLDQFNIFYQPDLSVAFDEYVTDTISKYNREGDSDFYQEEEYEPYSVKIITEKNLPANIDKNISSKIYLLMEVIKKSAKVLILIGVLYLLFMQKDGKIPQEYNILIVVSVFSLGLMTLLPFFSLHYGIDRAYIQLLCILSLSLIYGGMAVFWWFKEGNSIILLSGFILFYFLFLSGFIPQIVGDTSPSIQLNNAGSHYNTFYTKLADIKSGQWLWDNYQPDTHIYIEQFAGKNSSIWFKFSIPLRDKWVREDLFPQVIRKSAYVYLSSANMDKKAIFVVVQAAMVGYSNPLDFLDENKNLIYSNKKSIIYK